MLVLVRHGESAWNAADRFAGSVDVALTPAGRAEARAAGRRLCEQGVVPTVVHTSLLVRARSTADLMLDACGLRDVPVRHIERLNERHYGSLQGMQRADAADRYGAEQVRRWRRGIGDRPPLDARGRGESLTDVRHRLLPYVDGELVPALDDGHAVLVVSHGNTLRMLVQLLEGLTDEQAAAVEVPTGGARVYATAEGLRVG